MCLKIINNMITFSAYDLHDLELYQIIDIVITSLPLNYSNTYVVLCKYICVSLEMFYFLVKGHKEWLAEVQFLGIVNHPNLVKLLGYCSVDGERGIQRLLVYEFMPNRSLETHLFGKTLPTLPWKTRLEVMLGAAEGLAYLHEGLEIQVPQRAEICCHII